jgi:hypothetical protein
LPEENAREENGISNRQLSTTFIPPLTAPGFILKQMSRSVDRMLKTQN